MALRLSLLPTDQRTDRPAALVVEEVKQALEGLAFASEPVESTRIVMAAIDRLNHWKVDPTQRWYLLEEYFNNACPGCNAFEPRYPAWTKQLPPYVRLHHVPAAIRQDIIQNARA